MYIKLSSEILKIIIASKNWENMANLRRVILPFLIKFFFQILLLMLISMSHVLSMYYLHIGPFYYFLLNFIYFCILFKTTQLKSSQESYTNESEREAKSLSCNWNRLAHIPSRSWGHLIFIASITYSPVYYRKISLCAGRRRVKRGTAVP